VRRPSVVGSVFQLGLQPTRCGSPATAAQARQRSRHRHVASSGTNGTPSAAGSTTAGSSAFAGADSGGSPVQTAHWRRRRRWQRRWWCWRRERRRRGSVAVTSGSVTQRAATPPALTLGRAHLTKANVMTKMASDTNFKANFDGELTSSPLFLAGATTGTGSSSRPPPKTTSIRWTSSAGDGVEATHWRVFGDAPVCNADPKITASSARRSSTKRQDDFLGGRHDRRPHEIHALSTTPA